jgi:Rap1a immunity proteins
MSKVAGILALLLVSLSQAIAGGPSNGTVNDVLGRCTEAAKQLRAGDAVSQDYLSDSSFCAGFLIASAQAYLNDMLTASNGTLSPAAQCLYVALSGATPLQITIVFVQYATANPQTWSLPAYHVATQAFYNSFSRSCPR